MVARGGPSSAGGAGRGGCGGGRAGAGRGAAGPHGGSCSGLGGGTPGWWHVGSRRAPAGLVEGAAQRRRPRAPSGGDGQCPAGTAVTVGRGRRLWVARGAKRR